MAKLDALFQGQVFNGIPSSKRIAIPVSERQRDGIESTECLGMEYEKKRELIEVLLMVPPCCLGGSCLTPLPSVAANAHDFVSTFDPM